MTSLLAIESCFRGEKEAYDPWRSKLAGRLADLFIYGDTIRYTFPSPDDPSQQTRPWQTPPIVNELKSWDKQLLQPEGYSTQKHSQIADDVLEEFLKKFASWAIGNQATLKKWLGLHDEKWLRNLHNSHNQSRYGYVLDALRRDSELSRLPAKLGLQENHICYAVDIMLKYPLFGELAKGEHYLNHPIREVVDIPTQQVEYEDEPSFCVSFAKDVRRIVRGLSGKKDKKQAMFEFAALLNDLRGVCREDYKLHELKPGQIDKDMLREIAIKVKLSPRLKKEINEYGTLVGTIIKPTRAIVSVMNIIWKDGLPRSAVRWKRLHWAYTWDVEEQVEERE